MGSPKKAPKVEVRSRTPAGTYRRAGELWGATWTEAPAELVADETRLATILKDPYLEVKVDGEYVSGPRAKTENPDGSTHPSSGAANREARDLEKLFAERLAVLEEQFQAERDAAEADRKAATIAIDAAKAEAEAAKKAAAEAIAQFEALKKAASSTPAATDASQGDSKPAKK